MKVVLLRDIARIGKRYEVANVPDGYALNKLIPNKDAVPASLENVKRVESLRKGLAQAKQTESNEIMTIVQAFAEKKLIIAMETNQQGHLFKAVHVADITAALLEAGHTVSPSHIKIEKPIKAVGTYTVSLMSGEIGGELSIEIVTNKH